MVTVTNPGAGAGDRLCPPAGRRAMISRCTALVRGSQGPRFKRRGSQNHFLGGQGHLPSVCQVPASEQPYPRWGPQQHPQLAGPTVFPPSWEINSIRKQKPEPPNPTNKKLAFLCTERHKSYLLFNIYFCHHIALAEVCGSAFPVVLRIWHSKGLPIHPLPTQWPQTPHCPLGLLWVKSHYIHQMHLKSHSPTLWLTF